MSYIGWLGWLTLKDRMLLKTTEYLDHFARFKRKENVEAVERLLSAHKELAKFERAQLGQDLPSNLLASLPIFQNPIKQLDTLQFQIN